MQPKAAASLAHARHARERTTKIMYSGLDRVYSETMSFRHHIVSQRVCTYVSISVIRCELLLLWGVGSEIESQQQIQNRRRRTFGILQSVAQSRIESTQSLIASTAYADTT